MFVFLFLRIPIQPFQHLGLPESTESQQNLLLDGKCVVSERDKRREKLIIICSCSGWACGAQVHHRIINILYIVSE